MATILVCGAECWAVRRGQLAYLRAQANARRSPRRISGRRHCYGAAIRAASFPAENAFSLDIPDPAWLSALWLWLSQLCISLQSS